MTTRRTVPFGVLAAVLFVVPFTLLAACGGQGVGDGGDSDIGDSDIGDVGGSDTAGGTDGGNGGNGAASANGLSEEALLGEWAKVDDGDPACGDYPDRITFESYGYVTSAHEDRALVLDGGEWEIQGEELALSNPVDAMTAFPATLGEDQLRLDTGSCIVQYQRVH